MGGRELIYPLSNRFDTVIPICGGVAISQLRKTLVTKLEIRAYCDFTEITFSSKEDIFASYVINKFTVLPLFVLERLLSQPSMHAYLSMTFFTVKLYCKGSLFALSPLPTKPQTFWIALGIS